MIEVPYWTYREQGAAQEATETQPVSVASLPVHQFRLNPVGLVWSGFLFDLQEAEKNHPDLLKLPEDLDICDKAAG